MIELPPSRYIKDRGVSGYTYSEHADGYDDCLEEITQLLDLHGIPYQESGCCTKETLKAAGIDEDLPRRRCPTGEQHAR